MFLWVCRSLLECVVSCGPDRLVCGRPQLLNDLDEVGLGGADDSVQSPRDAPVCGAPCHRAVCIVAAASCDSVAYQRCVPALCTGIMQQHYATASCDSIVHCSVHCSVRLLRALIGAIVVCLFSGRRTSSGRAGSVTCVTPPFLDLPLPTAFPWPSTAHGPSLASHCPRPFLGLPLPFLDLPWHFSLTIHRLSLTSHRLFTAFRYIKAASWTRYWQSRIHPQLMDIT